MSKYYMKQILPNGARLVSEPVSNIRSACLGIWIGCGSRYETPRNMGASHFVEHMLFKGTSSRSAAQLANDIDNIGGNINAFTSKEMTAFYGRVLDERVPALIDILFDMLHNSNFGESDIISECGVINEEIDMYEDTPDELSSERLFSAVFTGSSISQPILGTKASLSKVKGASLKRYMSSHYLAGNIVAAISGSFTQHDLDLISEQLSKFPAGNLGSLSLAVYRPAVTVRRKPIEQNHINIGFPGCSESDPDRCAYLMLAGILGGGASSRLFRKLREELGLCYSVSSYMLPYSDCGLFSMGFALSKRNERAAIAALGDQIKLLLDDGVTQDEISRSMEQIKTGFLLGLESTSSRMMRLGRSELVMGYVYSVDEAIENYNRVTADDILRIARSSFTAENISVSAVGNTATKNEYIGMLTIS